MTPGPDQIVACPRCHGIAKYFTLNSGNTFGASVWTDGKQIAPMLPRPPAVVKCHHCMECYWLADAEDVGELDMWGGKNPVDPAWRDAEYVKEPTEKDYYLAIEQNLARDREQQRTLRMLAWWRRNDPFRIESGTPPSAGALDSVEFCDNLKILAGLLDEDDENDLIMKAEVLRELGEFEASKKVLRRIKPGDYMAVVRQLLALCEQEDAGVRELQFDA